MEKEDEGVLSDLFGVTHTYCISFGASSGGDNDCRIETDAVLSSTVIHGSMAGLFTQLELRFFFRCDPVPF
jgi:hypothetical protein